MRVDHEAATRQAKEEWRADARLREEFTSEGGYIALRLAETSGRVRVVRAPVINYGTAKADEQLTLAAPIAFDTSELVTLSGSDRGHLRGYAAVWGGVNRKGMRLVRGAFASALQAPLPMLYGHDSDKAIGRFDSLLEDARGLLVEGAINLRVAAGREAFELLSGQDVTGLSVGFRIKPGGQKVVGDVLEVTAADLYEISVVPVPAEARARVFEVKGA